MDWKLLNEFAVGGTTDLGFSDDSEYLLVASNQGRGLYKTTNGERIARDYEWPGDWHHDDAVVGIGPLKDMKISVFGLWNPTPKSVLKELEQFNLDSHITEFVSATISGNEKYLAIGFSSDVRLYERT